MTKTGKYHLSDTGRAFIAGLMRHAPETMLVTNQWVNSYKRLIAGYEAPLFVSWALRNRADMIRLPAYNPSKHEAMRVEYRAPDPSCNPYLAFAVILSAGLAGIENGYELGPPAEYDLYSMSHEERRKLGIQSLPKDLNEAIKLSEGSELLVQCLGEEIFDKLIETSRKSGNATDRRSPTTN